MNHKQELFEQINTHLMQDDAPSIYLIESSTSHLWAEQPFLMLSRLKLTEQSPKHHPEGNVWNHTMLVVDEAAQRRGQSKHPQAFMWAALLHDIGKFDTTKNNKGKITSYSHDEVGAKLTEEFLKKFSHDTHFIKQVVSLVRWHMHILYVVNNLPFGNVKLMQQQVDIEEIALLGLCDRLGRLHPNHEKEEHNIQQFLNKLKKN